MDLPPADEPLPDSLLEDGLHALFRSTPASRRVGRSVLETIEERTGPAPRVLLRDIGSGGLSSPLASAAIRPELGGPIQILGEIARGGMGVVLKGRDPDLGRDLALKVLREDLGDDPQVLRRFVEEAQITGQLQHPGIVPVYGIGLLEGERPYFTMKLILGRTLSQLLLERTSPAEDRSRFLAIFERVCQAIAYTHARGVVHRDLKPSNVMIGDFGETQVVDWGLAKVLPRGGIADERAEASEHSARIETVRHRSGSTALDSHYGTVMGTPAYMPPEQARGLVDSLDERSDVFSLGAILCTILTGKPPYEGEPAAVRRRAAEAELDAARARLGDCGADSELIELCLACLAPRPADRPRSAGVLAERMTAYLASVEERARAAQVAAAETRIRAREEKKRLLVGVIALVVLATAVVGGYAWIDGQRRARLEETELAVGKALNEATRLSGSAGSTGDPGTWGQALQAAQAARLLLEGREATPELRERVDVASSRIRLEAESSRVRFERDRRNDALLERLREARVPESCPVYSTDWSRVAREYAAAFTEAGLPLEGLNEEDAAAGLRESGIAVSLVAALDEWWVALRSAGASDEAARLARIGLAADDDPTRHALRECLASDDRQRLSELAKGVDPASLPLATRLLLANTLGRVDSREKAVAILRSANGEHPDDFATTVQLARWLSMLKEPPLAEMAELYRAALALRPDSVVVRHALGLTCERLGMVESALNVYLEAVRRRPEDGHLRFHVGCTLGQLNRHEEAIAEYEESLRLDPDSADTTCNLALSLRIVGRHADAVERLRETVRLDPDHHRAWYDLSIALQEQGDLDGAIDALREAIRIEPDFAGEHYNLGLALAARRDLSGARDAFREAVRCAPEHAWALLNLGISSVSLGDREGGIEVLRTCLRAHPDFCEAHRALARVLSDAGDLEGALAEYGEAVRLDPDFGLAQSELGADLLSAGRCEEAIGPLRAAVRCAPANASAWCNLGLALLGTAGRAEEALDALRRGHELGTASPSWSYPSARWIERAERAVDLEIALLELERGGPPPEDAPRALELASLARRLGKHEAATELYAAAFERSAAAGLDVEAHRPEALRSAALAASEPDGGAEVERARALAIEWLGKEVERLERVLDGSTTEERGRARQELDAWYVAPELSGLREPTTLSELPEAQREALLELWSHLRRRLASPD